MSSFICSPKHFSSVENSIKHLAYGNNFQFPYSFKEKFPELYERKHYCLNQIEDCISEIMDTLRGLTAICVSLQYRKEYAGKLDDEIAEQTNYLIENKWDWTTLSSVELLKAIECLAYQIETNHLKELRNLTEQEENALFFLKEMKISLAFVIVHETPSYKSAKWSIE
jgi:hypothetical protein